MGFHTAVGTAVERWPGQGAGERDMAEPQPTSLILSMVSQLISTNT